MQHLRSPFAVRLAVSFALLLPFAGVAGENDRPWFEVTKKLEDAIAAERASDIPSIFEREAPKPFYPNLLEEARKTDLTEFWGRSINFDEGAKATIVPVEILDFLFATFAGRPGVARREDRIVHAGVEHVYGYLFSNLSTSFGFKRARWVEGEIERGFALPAGVLSPLTRDGSFFSNVTAFFARIALGDSPTVRARIDADPRVSARVKKFAYSGLSVRRLAETVFVPKPSGTGILKTVEIRTDFVAFTGERGANTTLLLYSVLDSSVGAPRLISGFPVATGFVDGALDAKGLGDNQPVKTRYNAYVADFAGSLNGQRVVKTFLPAR